MKIYTEKNKIEHLTLHIKLDYFNLSSQIFWVKGFWAPLITFMENKTIK